jgi:zona occludens toxin (predicted ATPase)
MNCQNKLADASQAIWVAGKVLIYLVLISLVRHLGSAKAVIA